MHKPTALEKCQAMIKKLDLANVNLRRRNRQLEETLADAIGSLRIAQRRLGRVADTFTNVVLLDDDE